MLLSREFPSYLTGEKQKKEMRSSSLYTQVLSHVQGSTPRTGTGMETAPMVVPHNTHYASIPNGFLPWIHDSSPLSNSSPCDCIESPSKHCGPYIASWCGHTCDSCPGIRANVISFNRRKVGCTIKPPHHINMVIQ